MQPEPEINPKSVGCPYCTAAHVPTWRHDTQEWVHVIRAKIGERAEGVTVVLCTAANASAKNG